MTFDPFCECLRRESQHAADGGCPWFKRAADQLDAASVLTDHGFVVVRLDTAREVVADLIRPLVDRRRSVDDSPEFVALSDWLDSYDAGVRA